MNFTAVLNYNHNGIISSNFTGTENASIQACLESKTKEYLLNLGAPDCKIEFHTEADHIPHVTIKDLDEKHIMPLTDILNDCIK